MPKKTYALDPGGPARVEIEWRGMWKDVRVRVDGVELGVIERKKELEAGRHFRLPTGAVLQVQLARSFLGLELRVTRDSVPLPGSSADPAERVKQAAYMLYFIAALNIGLGALAEGAAIDLLRSIGLGWSSVVEGAVYGLLGWFTSRRSRVALGLGIGLFALDTISLIVVSMQPGHTPPVGGLVARFFFFIPLVKGFGGLRELRAAEPGVRRGPI